MFFSWLDVQPIDGLKEVISKKLEKTVQFVSAYTVSLPNALFLTLADFITQQSVTHRLQPCSEGVGPDILLFKYLVFRNRDVTVPLHVTSR